MQLHRFDDIQKFRHYTQTYLSQHEAEHNLLLGISHILLHHPERYLYPPYLAVVETDGHILGVALQTPPHKLVLSKFQNLDALTLIAQDLQTNAAELPGVGGLLAEVQAFLQIWQSLTGRSHKLAMEMRIHQLTAVQPIKTASGLLRPATLADRPLLLQWFQEFLDEAIASFGEKAEHLTDNALKQQNVYFWEDTIPVSFACGNQFLPTAARIGPVYTPPDYRCKGYATACVAALSQKFLNQGCNRCFLFTDLSNPTSNHLYQKIGYRPVCDWYDYSFTS